MADFNSPTGPAPSPELPLTLHANGNIPAVEFIKRLHRAGMELVKSDDGTYAVLRLAEKDAGKAMRERLFEACGVITSVRLALVNRTEDSEDALQDALGAAWRLVDNVAAALE